MTDEIRDLVLKELELLKQRQDEEFQRLRDKRRKEFFKSLILVFVIYTLIFLALIIFRPGAT